MMSYGGPPPMSGGFGEPGGPNEAAARQMVQAPAIALLLTGVIFLVVRLIVFFVMPAAAVGMLEWAQKEQAKAGQPVQHVDTSDIKQGPVGYMIIVGMIASAAAIIFGAAKMRNLESYGLAMTASILSMIPYLSPCCCFGLPFGIWALVVLSKPEVKGAFRS